MQASRSLVSCGPSACTARLGCRVAVQPGGAQPLIASSAQRAAALRRLTVVRAEGEEASNSEVGSPGAARHTHAQDMFGFGGPQPLLPPRDRVPQSPPPPPPAQEEEPIWVRREKEREMNKDGGGAGLPFGVYLLLSSFVAIAAVRAVWLSPPQQHKVHWCLGCGAAAAILQPRPPPCPLPGARRARAQPPFGVPPPRAGGVDLRVCEQEPHLWGHRGRQPPLHPHPRPLHGHRLPHRR